jgi:hypothetical protein
MSAAKLPTTRTVQYRLNRILTRVVQYGRAVLLMGDRSIFYKSYDDLLA